MIDQALTDTQGECSCVRDENGERFDSLLCPIHGKMSRRNCACTPDEPCKYHGDTQGESK